MDHIEYLELNNRVDTYRKVVTTSAAAWINENMPGIKVDNSFEDLDAYNAGLSVTIGDEGGEFLVWLTHNTDEDNVLRVRVPSTLLDGVSV